MVTIPPEIMRIVEVQVSLAAEVGIAIVIEGKAGETAGHSDRQHDSTFQTLELQAGPPRSWPTPPALAVPEALSPKASRGVIGIAHDA